MNLSQIKLDIYDWFKNNSEFDASSIIWANQSAPQPSPPYLTMNIISGPDEVGTDEVVYDVDSESTKVRGLRTFTLSLNSFGRDSNQYLSDIKTLLNLPETDEYFRLKGLSVRESSGVIDLSGVVETLIEERANMDVFFNAAEEVESVASTIENYEFEQE